MDAKYITRDDMVRRIISRMGGQCQEIEMVVEEDRGLGHVHMAIEDTEDFFYRYCVDEAQYIDLMVLHLIPGVMEYRVPDNVVNVIEVNPSYGNTFSPMMAWDVGPGESLMGVGGAGLGGLGQFDLITYSGALRYLQDVKKLVGTQYHIKFHPTDHLLRIYPTPRSRTNAVAEVYLKAKKSELYNNILFRDMAFWRAQEQLGIILKKHTFTMPGGLTINGKEIFDTAAARLEKLEARVISEAPGAFMMTDMSGI